MTAEGIADQTRNRRS